MKLACSTWMYSSFPTWIPAYPIKYVINELAKIGYEGIELGAASPVAYPPYTSKEDREKISDLLIENNIEISSVSICPGGGCGNNVASPLKAEREEAIKNYKDCVDLAYDLGAKLCNYIAGWVIWGVSQEKAWEWSRECLVEVAKYAQKKDIIIPIEPTPADSNLIETADDALKLMRDSGMNNVKVMFDTSHIFYRGEILTDYVEAMKSDLIYVHITDLDRMPPGTKTDFSLLINALKSINYQGYLTVEIGLGRMGHDGSSPNGYAKKAYEYIKSII